MEIELNNSGNIEQKKLIKKFIDFLDKEYPLKNEKTKPIHWPDH